MSGVDPKIFSGKDDRKLVNLRGISRDGLVHGRVWLTYKGDGKVQIDSNGYDFNFGGNNPWFKTWDGFNRNVGTLGGI